MFVNNNDLYILCETITELYVEGYGCPICGVTGYIGDVIAMSTIKHKSDCAYYLAKKLLEKKEALKILEDDILSVMEGISSDFIYNVDEFGNVDPEIGTCKYCGSKYYDVVNMLEESNSFHHAPNCMMIKIKNIVDRLGRI